MSDNYTADSEKFEIVHKMSRRIASVDKYCVISVANKAFEEYFGEIKETLIEVVAPQDKERLMDFIEKYDGTDMREKRVFSTVQCIIGSPDNVKGLFTIDRCKESAQWAEYEIEMAVVTASLINILAETECDDN